MNTIRLSILILLSCFIHAAYAQLYTTTGKELMVFFESDRSDLKNDQKQVIRNTIAEIGATNIREIYIEGHTDSFASNTYNLVLAKHRADETMRYLVGLGVPQRFIKLESFGESAQISDDPRTNRRAKIYFVYETSIRNALDPPEIYSCDHLECQHR